MLPDLSTICIHVAVGNRPCVTLPGGATVCIPYSDSKIPDPYALSLAALAPVNAALAPFVPIFDAIDVIVALVNTVKAIEDAIGPPPRPEKIAKVFPDLAKKLAKLLKAVPQFSVPVLIGGLLDILIMHFVGLRTQLLTILRKQIRILRSQTRANALGSVQLRTVTNCAQADLDAYLVNLNENAKPIGRLILILNSFLEIVGLPQIPSPSEIGAEAQQAIVPLDALISALTILRKGFP